MNIFQAAQSAGFAALSRIFSETGTITRGINTTAGVEAVRGETRTSLDDGNGVKLAGNVVDWLINADAYIIDDEAVEPEPGDIITVAGVAFEVRRPSDSGEAWRWSDRYRTRYRIHSVEVG